ncbi:MAG: hypothetical protein ACFFCD_06140 [Promethearchaeota archaeon]
MYIDAHLHTDVRSFEDLELMALAGIKAVTFAHDVYKMSTADVYTDHYDRLLRTETKRADLAGLELYVGLGIHPAAIPHEYEDLLGILPKMLQSRLPHPEG